MLSIIQNILCIFVFVYETFVNQNAKLSNFKIQHHVTRIFYAPGTPERAAVAATYTKMWNDQVEVPLYIGSEEIKTGNTKKMSAPHDHQHIVGIYHQADKALVEKAIASALEAP